MGDVHASVYIVCSLGKSCMTLLWIEWCFSFLSSMSQLSLSLQDRYVRGAEDSGDTTWLHTIVMASVLRAFLYCICNFYFQRVEILVLYPEQHCIWRSIWVKCLLFGLSLSLSLWRGIFHPPHCYLGILDSVELCSFWLGCVICCNRTNILITSTSFGALPLLWTSHALHDCTHYSSWVLYHNQVERLHLQLYCGSPIYIDDLGGIFF